MFSSIINNLTIRLDSNRDVLDESCNACHYTTTPQRLYQDVIITAPHSSDQHMRSIHTRPLSPSLSPRHAHTIAPSKDGQSADAPASHAHKQAHNSQRMQTSHVSSQIAHKLTRGAHISRMRRRSYPGRVVNRTRARRTRHPSNQFIPLQLIRSKLNATAHPGRQQQQQRRTRANIERRMTATATGDAAADQHAATAAPRRACFNFRPILSGCVNRRRFGAVFVPHASQPATRCVFLLVCVGGECDG